MCSCRHQLYFAFWVTQLLRATLHGDYERTASTSGSPWGCVYSHFCWVLCHVAWTWQGLGLLVITLPRRQAALAYPHCSWDQSQPLASLTCSCHVSFLAVLGNQCGYSFSRLGFVLFWIWHVLLSSGSWLLFITMMMTLFSRSGAHAGLSSTWGTPWSCL